MWVPHAKPKPGTVHVTELISEEYVTGKSHSWVPVTVPGSWDPGLRTIGKSQLCGVCMPNLSTSLFPAINALEDVVR